MSLTKWSYYMVFNVFIWLFHQKTSMTDL